MENFSDGSALRNFLSRVNPVAWFIAGFVAAGMIACLIWWTRIPIFSDIILLAAMLAFATALVAWVIWLLRLLPPRESGPLKLAVWMTVIAAVGLLLVRAADQFIAHARGRFTPSPIFNSSQRWRFELFSVEALLIAGASALVLLAAWRGVLILGSLLIYKDAKAWEAGRYRYSDTGIWKTFQWCSAGVALFFFIPAVFEWMDTSSMPPRVDLSGAGLLHVPAGARWLMLHGRTGPSVEIWHTTHGNRRNHLASGSWHEDMLPIVPPAWQKGEPVILFFDTSISEIPAEKLNSDLQGTVMIGSMTGEMRDALAKKGYPPAADYLILNPHNSPKRQQSSLTVALQIAGICTVLTGLFRGCGMLWIRLFSRK